MALQIRRGTEAQRAVLTGVAGELLYTTDTKKLYVGDGVTAGGTEAGGGQTGAEIKSLYEAEANAFTDTKNTKLDGIETGATATDLTAPGAIGSVTPGTGDFTTIGATTPGTGAFTTVSLTSRLTFATGANIASATTTDISGSTGNIIHITGTTTITAFTMASGQIQEIIFDGILQLTHHATTNKLLTSANITTAAGDMATYHYDGTTVRMIDYQRLDGTSLAAAATVFSNSYESSELNIIASTGHTGTHSLGARPSLLTATLRCKTANNSYNVNDEVTFGHFGASGLSAHSLYADATTIGIRFGSHYVVCNKSNGVDFVINVGQWKFILRGWV